MNRFTVHDEFGGALRSFYSLSDAKVYMHNKRGCTVREIAKLKAHINVLREALERSSKSLEAIDFDWECEHGFHQDKCPNPVCEVKEYWDAIAISKKALASTPAQHINNDEVIERCAKVCESLKEQDYCVDVRAGAEAIRALKGTA